MNSFLFKKLIAKSKKFYILFELGNSNLVQKETKQTAAGQLMAHAKDCSYVLLVEGVFNSMNNQFDSTN